MNEALNFLKNFQETFEQNISNGFIDEKTIKTLESNRINILLPFIKTPSQQNCKYVKNYVSKLVNQIRVLNYARSISDTDNNYALLRIKDFLCDLFFTIFSSNQNEITLQDIFNLIQLVSEIGKVWLTTDQFFINALEGWLKKVNSIMKSLINKTNEVVMLVNLDNKYYSSLLEYFNFYIEYYLLKASTLNKFNEEINLSNEINAILSFIKNVKFLKNETNTKVFVLNLLKAISNVQNEAEQVSIFEHFDELKFKFSLPGDFIIKLYKIYLNVLIDRGEITKAEDNMKMIIQQINPETKEEVEFYLIHLYLLLQKNEEENKIKELIEIIYDHKELTMEDLEQMMIKFTKYKYPSLFIDSFFKKITECKNMKFPKSKFAFTFDTLIKYPEFTLIFLYILFNNFTQINTSESFDLFLKNYGNSSQVFDFLKNLSESLLENITNNAYIIKQDDIENSNNYEYLLPSLLHNIVTLFLKYDPNNDGFGNYYLVEIIKKTKETHYTFWKDFLSLSIEIYIEKKDHNKLKAVLSELEIYYEDNPTIPKSCLYFYAKIILIISEGNKWNAVNKIQQLCLQMNLTEPCELEYYIKIFYFIYASNHQDVTLFSILMMNYATKYCEIINKGNGEVLNNIKNEVGIKGNKIYSLFDCFYEVLFFTSKLSNFSNQIHSFVDVFELLANLIENRKYKNQDDNSLNKNNNDIYIASSISIVIDLLKLIINLKNSKMFDLNSFPEFLLISLAKMMNFVFLNFEYFFKEEFVPLISSSEDDVNVTPEIWLEKIKPIVSIIELFQNLKIFYISYEFDSITNTEDVSKEKMKKLNTTYKSYHENLMNAYKILLNYLLSQTDNSIEQKLNDIMNNIFNSSKTVEQILNVQLVIKLEEKKEIELYIINLLEKHYVNKKFIFLVNSILFQSGFKDLCYKLLASLLNKIIVTNNEIFMKIYSIEDTLSIFKDLVSMLEDDEIPKTIQSMQQFQIFLCKLYGKIDDTIICDNIEWIYYKIYLLLENKVINNTGTETNNYNLLKLIFEELNSLGIRNKTLVMNTLVDLIMKKLLQ